MQASIATSNGRSNSLKFNRHLLGVPRGSCAVSTSRRTAQACATQLGLAVSPATLRIQRLVGQGSFGEVFEVRIVTLLVKVQRLRLSLRLQRCNHLLMTAIRMHQI